MDSYEIETYKVRTEIARSGNPVRTLRNRILELDGAGMAHGIVLKGLITFSSSFNSWSGTPASGFYADSNPLNPRIFGWLPSNEFSYWYDLVRSESPVRLYYLISPINGAKYIRTLAVGTSDEPVGEGPADIDA